jgi:hypothetical protein
MIIPDPDDKDRYHLDFQDWDATMMALASRLHQLPLPPGETASDHELGIDRLAKLKYGHVAVELLAQQTCELNVCPSAEEVVKLGQAVLLMQSEVELVRRRMQVERISVQQVWRDRTKRHRVIVKPKSDVRMPSKIVVVAKKAGSGERKVGFRRGN